ncbi:hypothetical protein LUZ60_001804 [Juncus effusus]|nr:hypothetical protein LUZ60_001804 [Juncus effusus]
MAGYIVMNCQIKIPVAECGYYPSCYKARIINPFSSSSSSSSVYSSFFISTLLSSFSYSNLDQNHSPRSSQSVAKQIQANFNFERGNRMSRAGGISNPVNVGIAVQADWENREFISNISLNVRRLFEFLLQFEATTKSKLASLNEKLDSLERKLEGLEVQVSSATTNPSVFNS